MDHVSLISLTEAHVRHVLGSAEAGHNWWHAERVRRNAIAIHAAEGGLREVIELAALLHAIADHKFYGGDEAIGPATANQWLLNNGAAPDLASSVAEVIRGINYKGPKESERAFSLEHAVVQDADRLDAIGAIGIARTFAFGGYFKRQFFDPGNLPNLEMDAKQYRHSESTTINHFFEKLLLLQERMLTGTGKNMARERHARMRQFLRLFFEEWFQGQALPPQWQKLLLDYKVLEN